MQHVLHNLYKIKVSVTQNNITRNKSMSLRTNLLNKSKFTRYHRDIIYRIIYFCSI